MDDNHDLDTPDTVAVALSQPDTAKVSVSTPPAIEPGKPRQTHETTREYRSRYERERRQGLRGTGDKAPGVTQDVSEDTNPAPTQVDDSAVSSVALEKVKARRKKSGVSEVKATGPTPEQIAETEQFLTGIVGLGIDTGTQLYTRKVIRLGYKPPQFPAEGAQQIAHSWAPYLAPYLSAAENAQLAMACITTVVVIQAHGANVKESVKEFEIERKRKAQQGQA